MPVRYWVRSSFRLGMLYTIVIGANVLNPFFATTCTPATLGVAKALDGFAATDRKKVITRTPEAELMALPPQSFHRLSLMPMTQE